MSNLDILGCILNFIFCNFYVTIKWYKKKEQNYEKLPILIAIIFAVSGCITPKPKPKPIELAPLGDPIEVKEPYTPDKPKNYDISDKIVNKNKVMKPPVKKIPKIPYM